MFGELNDTLVENILKTQFIGRIGCHANGITYVVPVTYVYNGMYVYAHSVKGMKIDMMRINPEVCFEVEVMQNMANWQSVIAWGKFEEITNMEEKQQAMQKIISRMRPMITSETTQPTHGLNTHTQDVGNHQAILFRIKLNKKTGRFEKR
jgi:nitroimidazol reductase NimA-like FMN-containing flavoprotein (pyridoxamine 5'-phosphate oxidase superfamily)